jgi:hypothetical protein
MNDWKLKAGIVGAVILVIAVLLFIIKNQHDMIQQQKIMQESVVQMKQLQNDVVRSQAEYVSKKDLEAFAKHAGVDLGPIQDDVKKLGAQIQGISNSVVRTSGMHKENIASSAVVPRTDKPQIEKCPDGTVCPNADPFGYQQNSQKLDLSESFSGKSVPWGNVKFSAWKDKPWDLVVEPRVYSATTVVSVDDNGRHFAHNELTINVKGKKYTIPIEHSEFAEIYPSESFHWSPHFYLGYDFGVLANPPVRFEMIPNLQLSLFSYGKTKMLPSWSFLGIGVGYEIEYSALALVISPVNFNVGKYIPFMSNVYVGPTVSIDAAGNVGILGGIRVGL